MVVTTSIEEQLKRIKFNPAWNRAEALELETIVMPGEEIFECVSGWYEGGVALVCATNIRIILIDKKPFKYLTVEDIRFDMINEIDYSHRLMKASIRITTGLRTLVFSSYNQQRLRKLITHVQHRMAELKSEQVLHQQEHLAQLDQRLHSYMDYQDQRRQQVSEKSMDGQDGATPVEAVASSIPSKPTDEVTKSPIVKDISYYIDQSRGVTTEEILDAGKKEVFQSAQYNQAPLNKTGGFSYQSIEHTHDRKFDEILLGHEAVNLAGSLDG